MQRSTHGCGRILSPILHDLAATCVISFEICEVRVEHRSRGMELSFTVGPPLGSEARMTFLGTGKPQQDIVDLMDKVKDVATDALWFEGPPKVWPECPEHPASHALRPTVVAQRPVWQCPLTREIIAEIGSLAATPELPIGVVHRTQRFPKWIGPAERHSKIRDEIRTRTPPRPHPRPHTRLPAPNPGLVSKTTRHISRR
jgi:hypothetical protein